MWPVIILILFIIIGFPFITSAIAEFQEDNKQSQEDRSEARSGGNNPQIGDIICTLFVEVRGEVDVDKQKSDIQRYFINALPNLEPLYVYIGKGTYFPDGVRYHWDHCYQKGKTSLSPYLSWWSKGLDGSTKLLSVVSVGNSFTLEMTGISDSNSRFLTSAGKTKTFETKVEIPDWKQIKVPYAWTGDFVIPEVTADDYTISIMVREQTLAGKEGSAKPFTFKVTRPYFG